MKFTSTRPGAASPGRPNLDEDPLRGLLHDGLLRRLPAPTRELLRLKLALALALADPMPDPPKLRGLSLALEEQTRLIRG